MKPRVILVYARNLPSGLFFVYSIDLYIKVWDIYISGAKSLQKERTWIPLN